MKRKIVPVLLFLVLHEEAVAQTPITLQAAIDTAFAQNLDLQAARLKTMAARKMEGSAVDLPYSSVTMEYGSINSAYGDTRLGIAQSFSFPVVYQRQRALLEAQTSASVLGEEEMKRQLRKEISLLYYQILLTEARKDLLLEADSLFQASLDKQEQRFRVGDINLLEKTTAETQRMQIANQLQQLEADRAALQVRFSSLLHPEGRYTPVMGNAKADLLSIPDSADVANHPLLKLKQQQQLIAQRDVEMQKAKLLPQLSLGYVNQSIRGVQSVDGVEKHYTASDRFSSVVAGVGIPIFAKPLKARIAAGRYQLNQAQVENRALSRHLEAAREQLLLRYRKNGQQLRYFEQYALKQAKVLREHSTLQLNNGDIGYLEWMLLVHQSIQLHADYFDALNAWNATVIELNTYTSN